MKVVMERVHDEGWAENCMWKISWIKSISVRADWKEEKAHMNMQITNTLDMNTVDWEVWH